MRTYSKQEIKALRAASYSAECNGTFTYIKAYSKENAVKYFQKLDESIEEQNVQKNTHINSHGTPVDRISEPTFNLENGEYVEKYSIVENN